MIFSTEGWRLRARAALLVSFYWLFGCGGENSHVDDNNIRADVIDCEEAAAHLRECCPNATSLPDCHFSKTVYTCGWPIEYETNETVDDQPITTSVSVQVASASCGDLRTSGDCERVWPQTQPDPPATPEQILEQEQADGAHPDGPCGAWGQL